MDHISPKPSHSKLQQSAINKATSVLLSAPGYEVEISKEDVKKVAQQFSAIAFKLGDTNDKDTYTTELVDAIWGSYQEASKQLSRKKL